MPIGRRASAPRSTGTATRNAVCVAERWNFWRKTGANALISPHAAKQMVNEIVPSRRCRCCGCCVDPTVLLLVLTRHPYRSNSEPVVGGGFPKTAVVHGMFGHLLRSGQFGIA